MASTLQLALVNQTSSSTVYAYITGQAIDNNGALFLLQADGKTPYYPQSPSATGQQLASNCAIPLGAPGNTVYATIPRLAGARLWFSVNDTLTFLLNPGPGLVEPSVTNNSDPNINKTWDFCEFTFNSSQLYANITYVDFVALPISLTLTNNSDTVQHISGMNAGGFNSIVSQLQQQQSSDGQPWGSLVVNNGGQALRVLSPNSYISGANNAFSGYFQDYVNQCWQKYANGGLTVDTQAQWGAPATQGGGAANTINFGNGISFAEPSAADIFSCSTGPFAGGSNVSAEQLAIGARLAAALNRTTLLQYGSQPDGTNPTEYYKSNPTNHYARIVHQNNLDGRGYTFPYDDVTPGQGQDQSGYVSDGAPKLFTITVGGSNATNDINEATKRQNGIMANMPKAEAPPATGDDGNKDGTPAQPKPETPAQPQPKPETPAQPTQPETKTPGCCGGLLAKLKRKKN